MKKSKREGNRLFNQAWMLAVTVRVLGPNCTFEAYNALTREVNDTMHGIGGVASLDGVGDKAFHHAKCKLEAFDDDLKTRLGLEEF